MFLTLYVPNARATAPSETPSATDIEDIAARGYIYGLPLVMHYAITYAYAVDRDSGQYKAPFNTIRNGTQVFTYKDTAVITPNSDTPYSFACLDLRAEPMSKLLRLFRIYAAVSLALCAFFAAGAALAAHIAQPGPEPQTLSIANNTGEDVLSIGFQTGRTMNVTFVSSIIIFLRR